MTAVRMSESLVDVRTPGHIKFTGGGEDMSKRSSPLPPPPLLLSAATTPSDQQGDHHHQRKQSRNTYQTYHQTSPSPHHHHQQQQHAQLSDPHHHQRRYFKEEVADETNSEGDDYGASSPPSLPPSDSLPPVKFNILGKMQMRIMTKPLNSSSSSSHQCNNSLQSHIKPSHGQVHSQSDTCNRDENKSPLISSNKPSHSSPIQQSPTTTTNATTATSNNSSALRKSHHRSSTTQQRSTTLPAKHKTTSHENKLEQLTCADSPLDFSTKKFKLDHKPPNSVSPSSRLRNILSMKSPDAPDNFSGTILNLSKAESPLYDPSSNDDHKRDPWYNNVGSNRSDSRSASRSSSNYSSSSPKDMDRPNHSLNSQTEDMDEEDSDQNGAHIQQQRAFLSSPRLPSQAAMALTTPLNTAPNPLNFTPFGSVFANSNLSQMSQHSTAALQIPQFDTSPPVFSHHITASAGSPTLPFESGVTPVSSMSSSNNKARATRPFKAYPKDPMSFSAVGLYGLPLGTTPGSTEALLHQQSNIAYAEFRKQMLNQSQMNKTRRGGQRSTSGLPPLTNAMLASPNGPNDSITFGHRIDGGANSSAEDSHSAPEDSCKSSGGKTEQQMKDEAYWERRRKNNEAAKRSRDARRAKEDEIAIRAAFLEQENLKLRFELCALKNETAKLRCMLYSS